MAVGADGLKVTAVASWLDKSLVYFGNGDWRIVPASTRVKLGNFV